VPAGWITDGTVPAFAASAASSCRFRSVADDLDVDAMIERFRERAAAVKKRNLPPVAGEERTRFLDQARTDFQDFAMLGDAEASLEDGVLVLRVDLRAKDQADG
jgi:hypothetical protein